MRWVVKGVSPGTCPELQQEVPAFGQESLESDRLGSVFVFAPALVPKR